jgi:MYXO-CTERM domain-containing protein
VDRRVDTWLHVSVSAPIETPLILIVRTEDEVAGTLVHSSTPYGSEQQGYLGLVMPLPDETVRCVDVELVDLRAAPVFREVLCPEPDAPALRSFSVTLPAAPDALRATASSAEARDSCSLSPRSPPTTPSVLGWGAALLFALARYRRRNRATTSRGAANARASLRAAG